MAQEDQNAVRRYHQRTKHHFHRYARSAGFMDWETQPEPFRFYEGAPTIALPLLDSDPPGTHLVLYTGNRTKPQPLTRETAAGFLELSLGLSAWKAAGRSRWSLRINPSSGNLHPTEGHLVLPPLEGAPEKMDGMVCHYNPLVHALERRATVPPELMAALDRHFRGPGFLAGLTSIFWRESWKYGERAFRYCNHDVGHALACLRFSANLFGWRVVHLGRLSDAAVSSVLGLDRTPWVPLEAEHPDLLCRVVTEPAGPVPRDLPPEILEGFSDLPFGGRPKPLGPGRVDWKIIYETAEETLKPDPGPEPSGESLEAAPMPPMLDEEGPLPAAAVIRRRRSAVAFDPSGAIERPAFRAMLDKTLARPEIAPFDVAPGKPRINLLLFVHRVADLGPGLYLLLRTDEADGADLRGRMKPGFLWHQADSHLPLYLLESGDFRETAMRLSCHQEIAGSSAFSLGMLARFRGVVDEAPHRYRHLFWESGLIGQVLYLEAEAQGVRGTGIGCFFDDPVHELAGLDGDDAWQSIYHFTVGVPVEDPRLATLPPYGHLEDR